MLERTIALKRNPFFVFTLRFLPIIFWGGMFSIWTYYAFSSDISKWSCFFFFVIAICFGINDLRNNNKSIRFSETGISILRNKGKELIVEKFYPAVEFVKIDCNETFKNVYLTLNTEKSFKRYELLKYNSAHMLGADKFFMVKAEMCRYFPSFAHECIDDEVKAYLETGNLSEFIKNKIEIARCQAAVLFVAELVFTAIPLGLCLLAFSWVIVKFVYHFLLIVVWVLDKLKL